MPRTKYALLVCLLSSLFSANAAYALTTAWTNAAGGNWSVGGNWDMGSPGAADTVRFVTAGIGQTTTMDIGASTTIGEYEIYQNTTNATHTLDLGSNALTMTNMRLAVDPAATVYYGHLNVNGTAGSAINVTGTLDMATGRGSRSNLTLQPDVALNIGTNPSSRGNLYVIHDSSVSFALNTATLTPGTTFNAYLNNLYVSNEAANGELNVNVGTLNLASVTSGILDVAGDTLIGEGFGARGVVTVSNNVPVKLGVDSSTRGRLRIASGDSKVAGAAGSSLTLGTGTIEAWLTDLSVAHATSTSLYASTSQTSFYASGQLDLTNVSGGFIDVAGPVRVGTIVTGVHHIASNGSILNPAEPSNYSPSAIGTLKIGAISVSSTSLTVGHPDNIAINGGVPSTIGSGTLELYGTTFNVSGAVAIDGYDVAHSGQVMIEVEGVSAGLLLGAGSTLNVGNGSIDITFLTPNTLGNYFGLRWEGDHVAELLALGSKLTWDDTAVTAAGHEAVSIYYLGGFTYVGTYIPPAPEPSTLMLLGLGGLGMVRHSRRCRLSV